MRILLEAAKEGPGDQDYRLVQDLSRYRTPPGFRGAPAIIVQLWWIVQATLFRYSPQIAYGWRRWLLRCFGAKIGRGVLIRPTARIVYPWKLSIDNHSWIGDFTELYTLGRIEIGANVCVSQYTLLITGSHDHRKTSFDIFAKPIVVEDETWIAAGAFLHPGVRIGRGSVVAARAVVTEDCQPYSINAGSPSRRIGSRHRHAADIEHGSCDILRPDEAD